jgi:hypothetical protein
MIYLGNNKFGLGSIPDKSFLEVLKKHIIKVKTNPDFSSSYLKPKDFNTLDVNIEVLCCIPLKTIKYSNSVPNTFSYAPISKPKKDYSKMRILNCD